MTKKITLLYVFFVIIVSLVPIPKLPFSSAHLFETDKLLHFFIYFIMTLMFLRVGFLESKKIKRFYLLLVFLIGFIIEIFQGILPTERYFEFADIIANSFGIISGYLICYFILLKINTNSFFFKKKKLF